VIGKTISRYRIVEKLGQGGMGEVFLADDLSLDRKVALKFLPESTQTDPLACQRFLREAKSAAALDHPFICRIFETGEVDGRNFIAMEYVAGEPLSARLARGPLPLREALALASEIAEALGEAHEKGIVHRDLKPSNIMLTSLSHAKILDFGLAKQIQAIDSRQPELSTQTQLTQTGAVIGTLAYMSPEQARGDPVDARSDIFSFGVVLYEMLSGVHPFRRPSQVETLSAILRDEPDPLSMEIAGSPQALRDLLRKATAKDPAGRYQSIKDLASDLDNLKEQLSPRKRSVKLIWALCAPGILIAALVAWNWGLAPKLAPSPPAGARPSVSVLIADFKNHTGDAVFDGTLEPYFADALEGASFITSFDRREAHKIGLKLRPGAAVLDDDLAQLVARREGVSVVVIGAIDRQPPGFRVSVSAVDAASGKTMASREEPVIGRNDVLNVVGKLVAPIRKTLGDTTPASVQVAAEETFTAGSLEAAHHYAQAQSLLWEGKQDEAISEYSSAIQLDPDFGRALAGKAAIYFNRAQFANAEKFYLMALEKIDRMSEREKFRTRGGYYLAKRDYANAKDVFSEMIHKYPDDTSCSNNLALAYFYGRDMASAIAEQRRAVKRYPANLLYRSNLALYAMYAGDFPVAEQEAATVLEQNPKYELAFVALALSELAQGRVDQATAAYKRLEAIDALGASTAALGLADIALYQGRAPIAAEILEKGIEGDRANNNPSAAARKLVALAQTRLLSGNTKLAIDAANQAIDADPVMNVKVEAARLLVEADQIPRARSLASELGVQLEPDPRAFSRLIQGEIQLKGGNFAAAINLFREAKNIADTWLGHFDSGSAYLRAGAFTEADSDFEACLIRRGEATAVFLDEVPSYRYLPPAHYYLGRAQEGLKSPAASESYRAFLTIKEKSIADPLVADARRRLESRKPQDFRQ
jgi:tetratricopeptide (TPR) repeat protein